MASIGRNKKEKRGSLVSSLERTLEHGNRMARGGKLYVAGDLGIFVTAIG